MPSTNILPPQSFAQTQAAGLGHAYVFAAQAIREELVEKLNVLDAGLMMGVGDLQGSGSDVIRVTRYGGVGYAEEMTAMADETSAIPVSGATLGYDEVTIGRYGLAKEQTYQDQILGRPDLLGLEDMAAKAPESWLKTMRVLGAEAGATFAGGVGTSGAVWTYDDEIDLIAYFHETEGFDAVTMPVVSQRHSEQYTQLRQSIRNEPGLRDAALHQQLFSLSSGAGDGAFDFLGIRNFKTDDVPTSGGDHIGSAYVAGAIAWVVASTLPVQVRDPARTTWVPEFGIVLERTAAGNVAGASFDMNAWMGVDTLDPALFPQTRLVSIDA